MTRAALIKHIGPRVVHVTARDNLPMIERLGLMPAADIAKRAGVDPEMIVLRTDRRPLHTSDGVVTLNHQNPINHGLSAANTIVEGHTAKSWAAALDQRVFFSRIGRNAAFTKSVASDVPIAVISFDTAKLVDALYDRLYLSPLNSGNFTQGGAKPVRGDWLFVPVTAGLDVFRANRVTRGLPIKTDIVKELSVIGAISADILNNVDMRIQ